MEAWTEKLEALDASRLGVGEEGEEVALGGEARGAMMGVALAPWTGEGAGEQVAAAWTMGDVGAAAGEETRRARATKRVMERGTVMMGVNFMVLGVVVVGWLVAVERGVVRGDVCECGVMGGGGGRGARVSVGWRPCARRREGTSTSPAHGPCAKGPARPHGARGGRVCAGRGVCPRGCAA